jgi:hypothetical protein
MDVDSAYPMQPCPLNPAKMPFQLLLRVNDLKYYISWRSHKASFSHSSYSVLACAGSNAALYNVQSFSWAGILRVHYGEEFLLSYVLYFYSGYFLKSSRGRQVDGKLPSLE